MPNLPAAPSPIPTQDLRVLRRWAQASSLPASLAQRATILLLAAEGTSNTAIAEQLGITRPTVIAWRQRYTREGLTGLADRPRPGRAQTVRRDRHAEILATTLTPPPQGLGVTHWSSRLLATQLGVSHSTIARVWAEHNVKPWQTQTFKFSTDPQLDARVRDVVGLYLHRRCCIWSIRAWCSRDRVGRQMARASSLNATPPSGSRPVHGKLVMPSADVSAEGEPGDHDPGAAVLLESAHGAQPRLAAAMVGLEALLRCPDSGRAEAVASSGDQITKASSSTATATRRFAGSSTASS
jgi:hypothetical protein